MSKIKVEFRLDTESMTDEEYENQTETECILEESELLELVAEKLGIRASDICSEHFFIQKID